MENKNSNNLMVPAAIIVAGILIAGAIFLSHGGPGSNTANGQNQSEQQAQNTGSVDNVPAVTSADHILGNSNATITLIEYSDLECPFCKVFQSTMNTLMTTYGKNGDLAWVYRNFPLYLTLHPKAEKEAEASECVASLGGNQDFWTFINGIYSITPSNNGLDPAELPVVAGQSGVNTVLFNACLSSSKYTNMIEQDYEDALKDGGSGTPYIVLSLKNPLDSANQQGFVNAISNAIQQAEPGAVLPQNFISFSKNGKMVSWEGALPISVLKSAFDYLLANK